MHKVLLVDTNFSSIPIYEYFVKNGFEVFLIGRNSNDFLAKSCKNYICEDYSNLQSLEQIISDLGIDYIVPGCNDHSYETCSKLSDKSFSNNIDSFDLTTKIFNKKEFRDFANNNGVPVPKTYTIEQALNSNIQQLIVKPVDAFSGKGITKIDQLDASKLKKAVDLAQSFSRDKNCVVEDFVYGQLYSHSAFIEGKKIVKDFIVQEYSTTNPFVVDTSCVIFDFPTEILKSIRNHIEKISNILDLKNGLIHTQFIQNEKKFWFIEITRRCPGDLYSQLIELSTGYPYASKYASYFVNATVEESTSSNHNIIRHTMTQSQKGVFNSVRYKKSVHIKKQINISNVGDYLEPSPNGRVGIIFVKTQTTQERKNLLNDFLQRKVYGIDFINCEQEKNYERIKF